MGLVSGCRELRGHPGAAGLDGWAEEVHGQPEDGGQHQREGVLLPIHRQPGALLSVD